MNKLIFKYNGKQYEVNSGDIITFAVREEDGNCYEYEGEYVGHEPYGILFKLTAPTVEGWVQADAHLMVVDWDDFAGISVDASKFK